MTTENHGRLHYVTAILTMTIFILSILSPYTAVKAYAAWNFPGTELVAEAGIIMDADTGAVLFQKNPHQREYPASITKVLTALVVLENCDLTESVTFSHDDVYNVDSGSSNAQIDEGDVLSVEDCLHALLLKSANEAANALACHVAGSREAFAELMNKKAMSLGCTDSHFTNPSGLFDENHYTSAYDMALIGIAAMKNDAFMEIDSHLSYKLGATVKNPDGYTVYMEHKMLRQDTPYSDKRVVAGKTGFTKKSGNTLITLARENDRNLVAVVLKDKNPSHYTDTKALLDLGFNNTEKQLLDPSHFDTEEIKNRLIADTIVDESCNASDLSVKQDMYVSLPTGSSQDGLSYRLNYNLTGNVKTGTIAEIEYQADGLTVGRYNIEKEQNVVLATVPEETTTEEEKPNEAISEINVKTIGIIIGAAVLLAGVLIGLKGRSDSKKLERRMKERRAQRLKDMDMSEEDFMLVVEKKRNNRPGSPHAANDDLKDGQRNRFYVNDHGYESGFEGGYNRNHVSNRRNVSRGRHEQRQ